MEFGLRVLFLSFYFTPDLSAGSFRNTAFVDALRRKLPEGSTVDLITTLPNRYAGFNAEAAEQEADELYTIKRVRLPAHESGMLDQSRSFLTYAKAVRKHMEGRQYDLVFASSSRLMTAALGAWVARKQGALLYLDIRDIFVDTIKDVLPRKLAWLMKPLFGAVERWTVSRADRLNVVSAGFLPYFESRYPNVSKVVYTNGIDDEFLNIEPDVAKSPAETDQQPSARKDDRVEVLYAGNMGEGQGLHHVVPALASKMEGRVQFRLIGGGGRLRQLEEAIREAGCKNVTIEPPVNRAELIQAYQRADVLFLHLNDYDAFRKVLPSKLFEYGALGKPIWAGVAGYAASFVGENLDNAEVFPPCDAAAGIKAFERLQIADRKRDQFIARFARRAIMDEMAEDLVELAGSST